MNSKTRRKGWSDWCGKMPRVIETEHFCFHGIDRNPIDETKPFPHAHHSLHGIRALEIVHFYAECLERAWSAFVAAGRLPPETAAGRNGDKIPIYLFAADPYSHSPEHSCIEPRTWSQIFPKRRRCVPAIVLPVRSIEPTRSSERRQAAAAAVHELSHAFNMRHLPLRRFEPGERNGRLGPERLIQPWLWLAEGMAVADEVRILPRNVDWLRYSIPWLDHPEVSLLADDAGYQAGMFVRYLERRMQRVHQIPYFAARVWQKSATVWRSMDEPGIVPFTAIGAVSEMLGGVGETFCSSQPRVEDIFASGYCLESYFHWDERSPDSYEPLIERRHSGGRGVTRSWKLSPRIPLRHGPEALGPLACRYFRFFPIPGQPVQMQISVEVPAGRGLDLKAEVAVALPGSRSRAPQIIKFRKIPEGAGYRLVHDGPIVVCDTECDHVVLTVTNCAIDFVSYERKGESVFRISGNSL